MDKYKEYMDSVQPPEGLKEKLLGLEQPKKRPLWLRDGVIAAAAVLVVGLGVFGASRLWWGGEIPAPDIAPGSVTESSQSAIGMAPYISSVPEGMTTEPAVDPFAIVGGTKTDGGFEVPMGDMVSAYFMLPYIGYEGTAQESAASLAPPDDSTSRELTEDDIMVLTGGEDVLMYYLNWSGFTLSGHVIHNADGSVWMLDLWGEKEDMAFSLELSDGNIPPSCVVVEPAGEITNVWGVDVAGRYSGIHGKGANREVWMPESREVTFLAKGVGYRFTLYGLEGEAEAVTEMVARFVREAVLEGLNTRYVTPEGAVFPTEVPIGTVTEGDGGVSPSQSPTAGASTPGYDPNQQ